MRALVRRIQNRGYATMGRVAEHLDRLSAGDESNAVIDAADAVNLMTVHAAKGLEFPIIFLVNIGKGAGGSRSPIRLVADGGGGQPSVSIGDYLSDADADAVDREREETKRLLYVAVTRARDRLYLSAVDAWRSHAPSPRQSRRRPARLGHRFTDRGRGRWRSRRSRVERPDGATSPASVPHGDTRARRRPLRPMPRCARTDFGPMADGGADLRLPATAAGGPAPHELREWGGDGLGDSARLVGTLVHRLFEAVDPAEETDPSLLAERLLALVRPREHADATDLAGVIREAVARFSALASRPAVARLLASGERLHEVPFVLRRDGELVHGTIDTLVRLDDRVTVVEIKTGRRAIRARAAARRLPGSGVGSVPAAAAGGRRPRVPGR